MNEVYEMNEKASMSMTLDKEWFKNNKKAMENRWKDISDSDDYYTTEETSSVVEDLYLDEDCLKLGISNDMGTFWVDIELPEDIQLEIVKHLRDKANKIRELLSI